MEKYIETMKSCVDIIAEQTTILEGILKDLEYKFEQENIQFFNRPVANMGISEKVKWAVSIIKMRSQLLNGD